MHWLMIARLAVGVVLFLHAPPTMVKASEVDISGSRTYRSPLSEMHAIHKRLQDQWQSFPAPNGWTVSYITVAHFIPIQVAAFGLQGLYQAVMVNALSNQMTGQVVSNAVFITFGGFTLTLSSNEKISWALLHAFAARMWTLSGQGFTPGYTITFKSPNGSELRASLKVSEGRQIHPVEPKSDPS